MTPLEAALSIRFWAARTSSAAFSAPSVAAMPAFLVRVFSSLRTALLRSVRTMVWRLRLIWLLMLAKGSCSSTRDRTRRGYPPLWILVTSGPAGTVVGSPWTSAASATCPSWRTSTTGRARSPIASSSCAVPSTHGTCGPSTSTPWTSSASAESPSSCSRSDWTTRATSSTSSTPLDTSTSGTRCPGPSPLARAWSSSSTPPRGSRLRPSPTAISRWRTTSRSSPASTSSTCRPPTRTVAQRRSSRCSASRPRTSCASAPRRATACPACSTR